MKRVTFLLFFLSLFALILPVSAQEDMTGTWYVTGPQRANARACAQLDCRIIAPLDAGTAVTVTEAVQGNSVSGSTVWLKTSYDGVDAYIHSSLLTRAAPANAPADGSTAPPAAPTPSTPHITLTGNCPTDVAAWADAIMPYVLNLDTVMNNDAAFDSVASVTELSNQVRAIRGQVAAVNYPPCMEDLHSSVLGMLDSYSQVLDSAASGNADALGRAMVNMGIQIERMNAEAERLTGVPLFKGSPF